MAGSPAEFVPQPFAPIVVDWSCPYEKLPIVAAPWVAAVAVAAAMDAAASTDAAKATPMARALLRVTPSSLSHANPATLLDEAP